VRNERHVDSDRIRYRHAAKGVAPEKVHSFVQQIFNAPVGNVAQNSQRVAQTAHMGVSPSELETLVRQLTKHLDDLALNATEKKAVKIQLETLEAQLEDPDPVIIKQAGKSLRSLTEGVISSLIANGIQPGVFHAIHDILSRI
jgi:hypothetical protein